DVMRSMPLGCSHVFLACYADPPVDIGARGRVLYSAPIILSGGERIDPPEVQHRYRAEAGGSGQCSTIDRP
ncbi:hypothetical protein ACNJI7_21230, partial [Mycobacterium tuberculosis]